VQSDEGAARCSRLWSNVDQIKNAMAKGPWTMPTLHSAIVPLLIGAEDQAVQTAAALRAQGIFSPAIRYPTVARGQARLRLTVTAAHAPEDIAQLTSALGHLKS
jgi:7-keto-8-aminopelargonate synthetase-like enzyme